ncbi:hypothetical protein AXF42_Ash002877 [Apostasia shenzhenica]|uniref:Uncharacterized protein n=1 Tax=Apostasia shenzhenica TaxID=1088818 RepID=A0A2I0A7I3_9ASPA|nr:hypothetical protein AXF42_Ash002877 [Apostasia shenzhenica]
MAYKKIENINRNICFDRGITLIDIRNKEGIREEEEGKRNSNLFELASVLVPR